MVDAVAEYVQVLVESVDRRDLGRGHHSDAAERPCGERLVDAVDGVVVRESEQLNARPGGVLDHLRRGQLTVGVQGMRLKIEGRGVHAARGYPATPPECRGASCSRSRRAAPRTGAGSRD